jgi:enamine deaminase RidA (YjgF/YER057c/UK114 family)
MQIQRIESGVRMSQGVVAGGFVYLAGQVADNTNDDVKGQTAEVLAKIDAVLAKAGSSKSKLLSVTIFLKDIKDFAAMNQVWDSWVAADGKPARATVQAALATPAYLVEIQAVALL